MLYYLSNKYVIQVHSYTRFVANCHLNPHMMIFDRNFIRNILNASYITKIFITNNFFLHIYQCNRSSLQASELQTRDLELQMSVVRKLQWQAQAHTRPVPGRLRLLAAGPGHGHHTRPSQQLYTPAATLQSRLLSYYHTNYCQQQQMLA